MWSLQIPPWWERSEVDCFTLQAHASLRMLKFNRLLQELHRHGIQLVDIANDAQTNVKQLRRLTQERKQGSTLIDYRVVGVVNRLLRDRGISADCEISILWPARDVVLAWTTFHVLEAADVRALINPTQATQTARDRAESLLCQATSYATYMIQAHGHANTNFAFQLNPLQLHPDYVQQSLAKLAI